MFGAKKAAWYAILVITGLWNAPAAAQGVRNVVPANPVRIAPAHEKMLSAGALRSDVLAINPYAFEGLEAADINGLRATGVGRFCDPALGFPCLLEAPVELPTGTTVTRLELDAVDAGASFVKANFYRCPVASGGCDLLAEVSTEGTPGTTQVAVDLTTPETIANSSFSYLLEVFPGDDSLSRLLGARLVFTGPESTEPTDVLALPAYAFEGRTPAGRAALRANGIQRYCTGTTCSLAAPVELPTGSSVTRIELDAVDEGTAAVEADFRRCSAATGICTSVGAVSSDTTSDLDLVTPEIIDNSQFTYVVDVSLGATIDTRLVGLRVFFDRPAPLPKTDRFSINPFAFESREAVDSLVLDEFVDERFCNGQSCTMMAPVELATGTRVERLSLFAWDDSAEEVRAAFLRCPEGSETCVEVAAVSTIGPPGDSEVGIDLQPTEIIDNRGFTYMVEVESGPNADTTLRSVSLSIERMQIFSDGFGFGDTSSWTSTQP